MLRVQCAVCSVQCAVCSVQCEVCSFKSAVCSAQCAYCSVYFAVCSVQYVEGSMHNLTWQTQPPPVRGTGDLETPGPEQLDEPHSGGVQIK